MTGRNPDGAEDFPSEVPCGPQRLDTIIGAHEDFRGDRAAAPGAGRVVCHGRAVRMSPGLVMASTGGNPGSPRCWTYEPGFIPGRD